MSRSTQSKPKTSKNFHMDYHGVNGCSFHIESRRATQTEGVRQVVDDFYGMKMTVIRSAGINLKQYKVRGYNSGNR